MFIIYVKISLLSDSAHLVQLVPKKFLPIHIINNACILLLLNIFLRNHYFVRKLFYFIHF